MEFISGHWLHEFESPVKAYPIMVIGKSSYITRETVDLMIALQTQLADGNPDESMLYLSGDDLVTEYEDGDKEVSTPIVSVEGVKLWPIDNIGSGWMWYHSDEEGNDLPYESGSFLKSS